MSNQFSASRALALDSAVEAMELVWGEQIKRPLRHLKWISSVSTSEQVELFMHETIWKACFWHVGFPVREDQGDYFIMHVKLGCFSYHDSHTHKWEIRQVEIEGIYGGGILLRNSPEDAALVQLVPAAATSD